ncbi:MAG: bifunctional phosphopantothenoylcysteine decarboxylase/phosphopantothenate--cysteine ligase CoaBC [Deltaproteobacteria bacterium]|nr:bifunctional phosphopantothenoylcysteine decarboxylase/phosphopantothenate--cysteine ligase CoaBC [Deltaproteobacteria bacterium]
MIKDKKIVIGVTGGIAAYKAAELVRILVKGGASVRVAMTSNAVKFVAPLTFETLSGNRVVWDMFDPFTEPIGHITWGQEADLLIIAPATSNFIAKMAHGTADDFLTSMVLASTAKILVCPAMNTQMYKNAATQENIRLISGRGCFVMKPGEGELACHTEGPGRLPEPEEIAELAGNLLTEKDLDGLKVVVTAGPTQEPVDPVRYITNRSSGKMGYAIARAATARGAAVKLISGPVALKPPAGIDFHQVKTAEEMRKAALAEAGQADVIIKAAAVSDYRPGETALQKIKKDEGSFTLNMIKNPDILAELGALKKNDGFILVGFAAETESLTANAEEKLRKKNLDMIVANDVSREDSGFDAENNKVQIIYRDGKVEDLPLMPKESLADQLLDRIMVLRKK